MKIIMHTKICDIIAIANKHVEMLDFANTYEASLRFFSSALLVASMFVSHWHQMKPGRAISS